jgi:hypothetical protein
MAVRRIATALLGLALLAACGQTVDPHAAHHPAPTRVVAPAGPFTTLDEVVKWTQAASGECKDVKTASMADFASYLGADRAKLYEPFVAEWATCAVPPFSKVGLVLFKPDGARGLQEFWRQGLSNGTLTENPDFSFGDGFAITSEELGTNELGLRHLWCKPVEGSEAEQAPAGVDGCVYATTKSHH